MEQLNKSFESFDEILADLDCRLCGENYSVLYSHHQIKEILEEYSSTLSTINDDNMIVEPTLLIKNPHLEIVNEEIARLDFEE